MAETKRVTDQYTISSPIVIVDGNLTVIGTTTSVESVNATISDNVIVFNEGETTVDTDGGIALNESGFEVDRGFKSDGSTLASRPSFKYVETANGFVSRIGSNLATIRVADPVDINDATTKQYVDDATAIGSIGAAGINGSVQYNNSGIIDGDAGFLWTGTDVIVGNTNISSNSITVDDTNGDLELSGSAAGTVYARSVIKMENETADPVVSAGDNQFYAKTPDSGGTGLFFTNATATDELVSKSKAIVFGIIF